MGEREKDHQNSDHRQHLLATNQSDYTPITEARVEGKLEMLDRSEMDSLPNICRPIMISLIPLGLP